MTKDINNTLKQTLKAIKRAPKKASKAHNNLRLIEMAKHNNFEAELCLREVQELFKRSQDIESFGYVIRYRDRKYSFNCGGEKVHDLHAPLQMLIDAIRERW